MITKMQMMQNDYDWYCILNDVPICVSSACRPIPPKINRGNYVIDMIRAVNHLESFFDFEVNSDYIARNLVSQGYEYLNDPSSPYAELLKPEEFIFNKKDYPLAVCYYSEYFARIARKGFFVFNGDIINERFAYHLISWPKCRDFEEIFQQTEERYDLGQRLLRFKTNDALNWDPISLVNINICDIIERAQCLNE